MGAQGAFFHRLQACMLLLLCLSDSLHAAAASHTAWDYYETLNVEPTATDTQIKKAFRTLAVKYHPDKNKSTEAEKAFREIIEAYKVLSNSGRRRQYDIKGHEAFLKNPESVDSGEDQHSNFHFSFTDFFHEFDDGDHSEEEPLFHWSFNTEGEDHYEHARLHFSFLFDYEEDYNY